MRVWEAGLWRGYSGRVRVILVLFMLVSVNQNTSSWDGWRPEREIFIKWKTAQWVTSACHQAWWAKFEPGNHMVEGKIWLLQVVLWPPHRPWHTCTHKWTPNMSVITCNLPPECYLLVPVSDFLVTAQVWYNRLYLRQHRSQKKQFLRTRRKEERKLCHLFVVAWDLETHPKLMCITLV